MNDLLLVPHNDEDCLDVFVVYSTFCIHQSIFDYCKKQNFVSARALISALIAFPTWFKSFLSEEDFVLFKNKVFSVLTGVLPDNVLNPPPRQQVSYGALDPRKDPKLMN